MSTFNFTAKVYPISNPRGAVRAFATLIVNDVIAINGFRVVEGRNGPFVSAPQKKGSKPDPETGKDVYYDEVRFMEQTEEGQYRGPVAKAAFDAILAAYNNQNSTSGAASTAPEVSNDRPRTRVNRW